MSSSITPEQHNKLMEWAKIPTTSFILPNKTQTKPIISSQLNTKEQELEKLERQIQQVIEVRSIEERNYLSQLNRKEQELEERERRIRQVLELRSREERNCIGYVSGGYVSGGYVSGGYVSGSRPIGYVSGSIPIGHVSGGYVSSSGIGYKESTQSHPYNFVASDSSRGLSRIAPYLVKL